MQLCSDKSLALLEILTVTKVNSVNIAVLSVPQFSLSPVSSS